MTRSLGEVSRYSHGLKVGTHIFEAAAWHYTIKPVCGACGHHALFDPHGLWWLFECKGWDDRLTLAAKRFRCVPCLEKQGQRGAAGNTVSGEGGADDDIAHAG